MFSLSGDIWAALTRPDIHWSTEHIIDLQPDCKEQKLLEHETIEATCCWGFGYSVWAPHGEEHVFQCGSAGFRIYIQCCMYWFLTCLHKSTHFVVVWQMWISPLALDSPENSNTCHHCIMLPKYYCELDFIEFFWWAMQSTSESIVIRLTQAKKNPDAWLCECDGYKANAGKEV